MIRLIGERLLELMYKEVDKEMDTRNTTMAEIVPCFKVSKAPSCISVHFCYILHTIDACRYTKPQKIQKYPLLQE